MISHVILGGIGTVVETSEMQLRAFNQAFAKLGIDFVWDAADYQASLAQAGGVNRLSQLVMADGSTLSDEQARQVHAEKTRILGEMMAAEGVHLRNGIADLLAFARDKDMTCGWATTTGRDNIDAICHASGGSLSRDMFAFVGDASMVERSKPDSEVYRLALAKLGIAADQAVAIEDSPTGVDAAKGAAIFTVAYPGKMNADKDFSRADKRVGSAGEVIALLES